MTLIYVLGKNHIVQNFERNKFREGEKKQEGIKERKGGLEVRETKYNSEKKKKKIILDNLNMITASAGLSHCPAALVYTLSHSSLAGCSALYLDPLPLHLCPPPVLTHSSQTLQRAACWSTVPLSLAGMMFNGSSW